MWVEIPEMAVQSGAITAEISGVLMPKGDREWAKCRICHGFDDENRIGEVMWGEVNLTCALEFPILSCVCNRLGLFHSPPVNPSIRFSREVSRPQECQATCG